MAISEMRTCLLPAILVALVTSADQWAAQIDCNGNGSQDATDVAAGTSSDCNDNGVPDECEFAPLSFATGEAIRVARSVRAVVTGDFNRDGLTDFAVGSQNFDSPSTVSLLINGGDDNFGPVVTFSASPGLSSMTAADLDQDGDVDLATAHLTSVLVLENQGEGGFTIHHEVNVEPGTGFIIAADVNGDSFPDLVTMSAEMNTVSVQENRRDLTFGDPVSLAVGAQPTVVAPGDLNGDGHLDLAVTNRDSGTVSFLTGTGDGGFAEAVHLDVGIEAPSLLVAEDLDGDRDRDLAIAGLGSLAILLNDGTGTFATPVIFEGALRSLVAGDVDADGDFDFVGVTRTGAVSVFVNNGAGRLVNAMSFRVSGIGRGITTADLNNDGLLDLAASVIDPERIEILWNNGSGGRAGVTGLPLRDPAVFPVGGEPHGATLGDVDGDGNVDIITGNNEGGLAVLVNDGEGAFGAPMLYLHGHSSYSVVAGDFDGDGAVDIASVGEGASLLQILKNKGEGRFEPAVRYPVRGSTTHITSGDFNNDGHLDLLVSATGSNKLTVFLNAGDGTFDGDIVPVRTLPIATAVSDLDGDGDDDIAVSGGNLAILLNRGDGSFGDLTNYPAGRGANFVVAGDIDGDGHVDLATSNLGTQRVSVFWGRGDGAVGDESEYFISVGPNSLLLSDVDADDRLDIITANPGVNGIAVLLNGGGRLFSDVFHYRVGGRPRWALAGDFDGDGVNDLVAANHDTHDVSVLINETKPSTGQHFEQLCTDLDFHRVSAPASRDPAQRATKYIVPARDDVALTVPSLFQNVVRYPFHEEFLAEAFPDVFGGLTPEQYNELVGRRESRGYYVGVLTRWPLEHGFRYSFTVVADTGFHPAETLRLEEIQWVYASLSEAFQLATLFYDPDTELARREVEESWPDPPPVPVDFGDRRPEFVYEAYSLGIGFGRVRLLTLEEFEDENRAGRFTFQDIPVVGDAPRDIEGVVGGFFTARVQGDLSHTAIRLARQGTPNAFIANVLEVFAPYEGKLVRVEVCEGGYIVDDSVTTKEAEVFWAANRPELPFVPAADQEYDGLDGLLEIDLSGESGVPPESRFGGKSTNLARLQRVLMGELEKYVEPGFSIPMRFYLEFMRLNSIEVDGRVLSYTEYLDELVGTAEFQTDSVARSGILEGFRRRVRDEGVVNPDLVERLAQRIPEVFGSTSRMVRFRSSSNVEDALEFNGAGLYDSTSACVADTLDVQMLEGSHCDPTRTNERTLERALKRVWTSLWTFRAFEERAYFQIPQETAAMGILVSRAFLDESANGVAFTGNPRDSRDLRYVVTAQAGEESVVSPEPGTTVERNLLTVVDGKVTDIYRDRSSSLVPPGETVLSDAELRELGSLMAYVDTNFPLQLSEHSREEVLLDFEFKIEPDGSLAVKQVRPFLRPTATREVPTFELEIPVGATACGVFPTGRPGRDPRVEYETKSVVRFLPGIIELRTEEVAFEGELFEEVLVGPLKKKAEPNGPGRFTVTTTPGDCNLTTYRFDFDQDFTLPDGGRFAIRMSRVEFMAQRDTPLDRLVLDEDYITNTLTMEGMLDGGSGATYASCGYGLLPLWRVEAEFEGGSLSLFERFLPSEHNLATGPAALVQGQVMLEGAHRTVSDYWKLVYSARRHNRDVRHWVVLDPPADLASVESPVHVVELLVKGFIEGTSASVAYLGENFEVIAEPRVVDFGRAELVERQFRRGDVDGNGTVSTTDTLSLLNSLFGAGPELACQKSADANDDGRLSITDAVGILLHLFGNQRALPEPSVCGFDPTSDDLSCTLSSKCR